IAGCRSLLEEGAFERASGTRHELGEAGATRFLERLAQLLLEGDAPRISLDAAVVAAATATSAGNQLDVPQLRRHAARAPVQRATGDDRRAHAGADEHHQQRLRAGARAHAVDRKSVV